MYPNIDAGFMNKKECLLVVVSSRAHEASVSLKNVNSLCIDTGEWVFHGQSDICSHHLPLLGTLWRVSCHSYGY